MHHLHHSAHVAAHHPGHAALRRADQHPDVAIDWPRVIDTVERAGRALLNEIEAEIVRALYWHLMSATYPGAANRREWEATANGAGA